MYKYKVLFFDLINKSAFYQRYINNILIKYLNDFCIIYLNNILIYFEDFIKYYLYIKKIFTHFHEAKLQINLKKYKFKVIKIKYLNYILIIKRVEINFNKIVYLKN
jgi:hypothetical protein